MEKSAKKNTDVSTKKVEEAPAPTGATAEKRGPIQSYHEGDVSVSIWSREYRGRVYYSASFERSYKSDSGWKYSRYFGVDELGAVAALAKQASDFLHGLPDRNQD